MKILIHGINFHPEPTGIGKYSGDMAATLAAMGHEVRVVTAPPYYPAWKISDGWKNGYGRSSWKGVDVWRAPLWVPAQPSGLKRIVHLFSFSVAAIPLLVRQLTWRPDVVIVVAPALACAPWAWLTARLSGGKAWLHVQDFEVDAAFDLGLLKSTGLRRLVTAVEKWLLRRFDRVSTISDRMLQRTEEKGVPHHRLVFLPNWVDDQAIKPLHGISPYRAKLDIEADAVVALFSGTLGGKQGLEQLPEVARRLADRPGFVMVICGDGVMKPQLEQACAGLSNVRMLPLQPAEQVNALLGMADIHLLPQNPGAADLVMPSKLTGMLASGRPVVTTAHAGTELARVVGSCGLVVEPGSTEHFADAIRQLVDNPAYRQQLGMAARHYAEQNLARTAVLHRLDTCLQACVNHLNSGVELPGESTQT
jgi:colanic acid biosynthesis glycosyl transferase WcaI